MKQVELVSALGSLEKELSHERIARRQDEGTFALFARPLMIMFNCYAEELEQMRNKKEQLEAELAEITEKYNMGTTIVVSRPITYSCHN